MTGRSHERNGSEERAGSQPPVGGLPADGDGFDLLGERVAEILRTAAFSAEQVRQDASKQAAELQRKAEEDAGAKRAAARKDADRALREAEEERNAAQRERTEAGEQLDTAGERLSEASAVLADAKANAEQMAEKALSERDQLIEDASGVIEDKLGRATRLFYTQLDEVRGMQEAAEGNLRDALSSLEQLRADLAVLKPDAVVDLTGSTDAKVQVGTETVDNAAVETVRPSDVDAAESPAASEKREDIVSDGGVVPLEDRAKTVNQPAPPPETADPLPEAHGLGMAVKTAVQVAMRSQPADRGPTIR